MICLSLKLLFRLSFNSGKAVFSLDHFQLLTWLKVWGEEKEKHFLDFVLWSEAFQLIHSQTRSSIKGSFTK